MDVREILLWLVDQISVPASARGGAPTADEVRQAIDAAYGVAAEQAPEPVLGE